MINGFKMTAKFTGKSTVQVEVQNLNNLSTYTLVWNFATNEIQEQNNNLDADIPEEESASVSGGEI